MRLTQKKEPDIKPICIGCNKSPIRIEEYQYFREDGYRSADDYVKNEEGTYNPKNGHFYCSSCYIKADMPLGVAP